MKNYTYISLREKPELKNCAAEWFHSKWGVPTEAYLECIRKQNMVGIFAWMKIKL